MELKAITTNPLFIGCLYYIAVYFYELHDMSLKLHYEVHWRLRMAEIAIEAPNIVFIFLVRVLFRYPLSLCFNPEQHCQTSTYPIKTQRDSPLRYTPVLSNRASQPS